MAAIESAQTSSAERPRASRERLLDVDRAKGLAIALVVLGHIVAREPPQGNAWFVALKHAIYCFHMPFFMYLGGVTFYYAGHAGRPRPSYGSYLARRAERLLLPFLLFGVAIVLGKVLAAGIVHVDNRPSDLLSGLTALVWNTGQSPALSVWYILVLFVYCAVTPALLMATGGAIWPLIAGGAVLHLLTLPDYLYLHMIGPYFVFFALGLLTAKALPEAMRLIDRAYPVSLGLFALAFAAVWAELPQAIGIPRGVYLVVLSLLSIPALHGFVRSAPANRSDLLLTLGAFSFVIYLLNTVAIGVTKGVMLKVLPWDGANFLVYLVALTAAGVILPILAKVLIFRRVPYLDRMTS